MKEIVFWIVVVALIVVLALCLLVAGCDDFEYRLIAKGNVTRIEIIGGGFMNPAMKVFYLDDGSLCIFGLDSYESVKIGDYVYVYYRDWDGKKISSER